MELEQQTSDLELYLTKVLGVFRNKIKDCPV